MQGSLDLPCLLDSHGVGYEEAIRQAMFGYLRERVPVITAYVLTLDKCFNTERKWLKLLRAILEKRDDQHEDSQTSECICAARHCRTNEWFYFTSVKIRSRIASRRGGRIPSALGRESGLRGRGTKRSTARSTPYQNFLLAVRFSILCANVLLLSAWYLACLAMGLRTLRILLAELIRNLFC